MFGLIIMFNLCMVLEVSLRVKCRLDLSVSSRTRSSMIVTLKHCLRVEGLEVKFTRGLLAAVISMKSASSKKNCELLKIFLLFTAILSRYLVPAVSCTENKLSEKYTFSLMVTLGLLMLTQSSNDPTSSDIDVKILSNPTVTVSA